MGFLNFENVELDKNGSKIIDVYMLPTPEDVDSKAIYHYISFDHNAAFEFYDDVDYLGAYKLKPRMSNGVEVMYIGDAATNEGKYYNLNSEEDPLTPEITLSESDFINIVSDPSVIDEWVYKQGHCDDYGNWEGEDINTYDVFVYKITDADGNYSTKVSFTRKNPALNIFETENGYWVYANSDKEWLRLDNEGGKRTTILDVDKRQAGFGGHKQNLFYVTDPQNDDYVDFKLSGVGVPDETFRAKWVSNSSGNWPTLEILKGGNRFPSQNMEPGTTTISERCMFRMAPGHGGPDSEFGIDIYSLTGKDNVTDTYFNNCELPTLTLSVLESSNCYDRVVFSDSAITPIEDWWFESVFGTYEGQQTAYYWSRRHLKNKNYMNDFHFIWIDSADIGMSNGGCANLNVPLTVDGAECELYHLFDIGINYDTYYDSFEDSIKVKLVKYDYYNVETYNIYNIIVRKGAYNGGDVHVIVDPIEINDGEIPQILYGYNNSVYFVVRNGELAYEYMKIRFDILEGPRSSHVRIRNPYIGTPMYDKSPAAGLAKQCKQIETFHVKDVDPVESDHHDRYAYIGTVVASEYDSKFHITFTSNERYDGVVLVPSTYEITIPGYYGDMSPYDRNKITMKKLDDNFDGVITSSTAILVRPKLRAKQFQGIEMGFYEYELFLINLTNATTGIDSVVTICKDFNITLENCVGDWYTTPYFKDIVEDIQQLGLYDLYDLHINPETNVILGNSYIASALSEMVSVPNPVTPYNTIEVTGNYNQKDESNPNIFARPIHCEDPKVFEQLLNVKFAGLNKYRYTVTNTYGPYNGNRWESDYTWGYVVVEAFNNRIIEHSYVSKRIEAEADVVKATNSYTEYVRTMIYNRPLEGMGAEGIAKSPDWSPWEPVTTSFALVDEFVRSDHDDKTKVEYTSPYFCNSKGLIYSYEGNIFDKSGIVIKNPKTGVPMVFEQDSWISQDSGYTLATTDTGFKLSKDGEDVEFDYDDLLNFLVYHDLSKIPEGSVKLDPTAIAGGVTSIAIGRLTVIGPDDRLPHRYLRNGLVCYNTWGSDTYKDTFDEYAENLLNGPTAIYSTAFDKDGNRIKLWPADGGELEGATWEEDGVGGTVPAPLAGEEYKLLNGNGRWDYGFTDTTMLPDGNRAPYTLDNPDDFATVINKYIIPAVKDLYETTSETVYPTVIKEACFPGSLYVGTPGFGGLIFGDVSIKAYIRKGSMTIRWTIEKQNGVIGEQGRIKVVDNYLVRKYTRLTSTEWAEGITEDEVIAHLTSIFSWNTNSWAETDDVLLGSDFERPGRAGVAPVPIEAEQYKVLTGSGKWEDGALSSVKDVPYCADLGTTQFEVMVENIIEPIYKAACENEKIIDKVVTFNALLHIPRTALTDPYATYGQVTLYIDADGANKKLTTRWYANARMEEYAGDPEAGKPITITRKGIINGNYADINMRHYDTWTFTDWLTTDDVFECSVSPIKGGYAGLVPAPRDHDYFNNSHAVNSRTEMLLGKGWDVNPSYTIVRQQYLTYESDGFSKLTIAYIKPFVEQIWANNFWDIGTKVFTFPALVSLPGSSDYSSGACTVKVFTKDPIPKLYTHWEFVDSATNDVYTRTGTITVINSSSYIEDWNYNNYNEWTWTDWKKGEDPVEHTHYIANWGNINTGTASDGKAQDKVLARFETDETDAGKLLAYFPIRLTTSSYQNHGVEEVELTAPAVFDSSMVTSSPDYNPTGYVKECINEPDFMPSQDGHAYCLGFMKDPDRDNKWDIVVMVRSGTTGYSQLWNTTWKTYGQTANGYFLSAVPSKYLYDTNGGWHYKITATSFKYDYIYNNLSTRGSIWCYGSLTDLGDARIDTAYDLDCTGNLNYLRYSGQPKYYGRGRYIASAPSSADGLIQKLCMVTIPSTNPSMHYVTIRFKPNNTETVLDSPIDVKISWFGNSSITKGAVEVTKHGTKCVLDGLSTVNIYITKGISRTRNTSTAGYDFIIGMNANWNGDYEIIDSNDIVFNTNYRACYMSNNSGNVVRFTKDEWVYTGGGSEGGVKIVRLTQAQYDALATKDPDTIYVIS